MKRNVFWMIWGVVSLVCVMIAGYKSVAMEIEGKTRSNQPTYLTSTEIESTK